MTITIATPIVTMVGIMFFAPPMVEATDKYIGRWMGQTILGAALLVFLMSGVDIIVLEIASILHPMSN